MIKLQKHRLSLRIPTEAAKEIREHLTDTFKISGNGESIIVRIGRGNCSKRKIAHVNPLGIEIRQDPLGLHFFKKEEMRLGGSAQWRNATLEIRPMLPGYSNSTTESLRVSPCLNNSSVTAGIYS